VPSTRYLHLFDLVPYFDGLLLRYPNSAHSNQLPEVINQRKMFDIVREHRNWLRILNLSNINSVNHLVRAGQAGDLIKVSEALHEKKVAEIADQIAHRAPNVRIVLIAGPSSSGKTSFAKRLEVQLRVAGLQPVALSLDNYFVNRENTPRDTHGEYNFEALEAINIPLFNQHILSLLQGETIQLPTFDFATGQQHYTGPTLQIGPNHIVLIEGIHGLNPKLTPQLPSTTIFRIYVSALTQLSIDSHNRIPSTDHRLIRRIVRDYKYRKYTALETLKRWPSVRSGEEQHIFPFQEEAEVMFNSSLMYELCVLKTAAEPLLREVFPDQPQFAEAKRLLKFLEYFEPIAPTEVPPTSILREFVGGSSFRY
jgi:uridine kinase